MYKYDFKEFFGVRKPIICDEYIICNYFGIKKDVLTNKQQEYVDVYNEESLEYKHIIMKEFEKKKIMEFSPELITYLSTKRKNGVLMDTNSGYVGIMEEYYNFLFKLGCKIYITSDDVTSPLSIYKDDEFVGIVLPFRVSSELIVAGTNYNEYIEQLKQQEQQKKEEKKLLKKCLYISNNKATVRNKKLICIADITGEDKYSKLYIEKSNNDFNYMFVDMGIVFMGTGRSLRNNPEYYKEYIKEDLDRYKNITIEDYKEYIDKCVEQMQFINVAEIKLMELAGESEEYIKTLTEHRQKVLDLRKQKEIEEQQKREQEETEYVNKKNSEVNDLIKEAEQKILNKEEVKNVDVTIYKSRYESNTTSLMLHMMKLYDIKIPLKTQGWINEALAVILYSEDMECYTYKYYNSSKNSTVFANYLQELVDKIKEKQ